MSIASVFIIGRLTTDPEQKVPASGTPYTKLRIAWNNRKDEPGYINATLFGKQAETAAKYLKKGSQVCLSGARLSWSEWEKDGVKRQDYNLVGGDLVMLGKKDDEQPTSAPSKPQTDDDIPF